MDIYREIQRQLSVLPQADYDRFPHAFTHIFSGGYAAGYYSYLWSEVLAVNIADYFAEHGALTRKVGDDFRQKVLSRGNTRDLMTIFSDFTGLKAPDTKGLLKARGM